VSRTGEYVKATQAQQQLFKMGQEQSSPVDDDTQCQRLDDRSVESVAKYIKAGRAKKVVVMVDTPLGVP